MGGINERFTDLADKVSELMGRWWMSVVSLALILGWTALCIVTQGAGFWYGTFYNLPLNLVTTVAELFIGFLLAAAANRSERHAKRLMQHIAKLEAEHGALLREIHAHIRCEGHTHIGAVGAVKSRHAVRGPDGRYVRVDEEKEAA